MPNWGTSTCRCFCNSSQNRDDSAVFRDRLPSGQNGRWDPPDSSSHCGARAASACTCQTPVKLRRNCQIKSKIFTWNANDQTAIWLFERKVRGTSSYRLDPPGSWHPEESVTELIVLKYRVELSSTLRGQRRCSGVRNRRNPLRIERLVTCRLMLRSTCWLGGLESTAMSKWGSWT